MNEKELKAKVNEFRKEMNAKNSLIEDLYKKIDAHKKDSEKYRTERDTGNDKIRELAEKAEVFKKKRDELNSQIAKLKEQRAEHTDKIKKLSSEINDSKSARDNLNESARGTYEMLSGIYESDMDALLNKDIPLDREIEIFRNISNLKGRLESSQKADEIHKSVSNNYSALRELNKIVRDISKDIKTLADESQENHVSAMKIYDELDAIRKSANESHEKLMQKYDEMTPHRDEIKKLKEDIKKIREDVAPYLDELDKIRLEKEEHVKETTVAKAKETLKNKKRLSMADFKLLLESDEIPMKKGKGVQEPEEEKAPENPN